MSHLQRRIRFVKRMRHLIRLHGPCSFGTARKGMISDCQVVVGWIDKRIVPSLNVGIASVGGQFGAVAGSVAGGAARFQLGGGGASTDVIGRVVVEFE